MGIVRGLLSKGDVGFCRVVQKRFSGELVRLFRSPGGAGVCRMPARVGKPGPQVDLDVGFCRIGPGHSGKGSRASGAVSGIAPEKQARSMVIQGWWAAPACPLAAWESWRGGKLEGAVGEFVNDPQSMPTRVARSCIPWAESLVAIEQRPGIVVVSARLDPGVSIRERRADFIVNLTDGRDTESAHGSFACGNAGVARATPRMPLPIEVDRLRIPDAPAGAWCRGVRPALRPPVVRL